MVGFNKDNAGDWEREKDFSFRIPPLICRYLPAFVIPFRAFANVLLFAAFSRS